MGHAWESMVIENLIRGLNIQGISFDYFHYRTSAGAEVDLVLEAEFGLIPVEIKYAQKVPFIIVSLGWILASLFGALPYYFYAHLPRPIYSDAPQKA